MLKRKGNIPEIREADRKKLQRRFNNQWCAEFLWLQYEDGVMKCRDCIAACQSKNTEAFVQGCSNFQRDSLIRHASSVMHRNSVATLKQKKSWEVMMKNVAAHNEEAVNLGKRAVMATAYWLAKEEIANHKFRSLIELQKFNGNEHIKTSSYGEYKHDTIVKEMQLAFCSIIRDEEKDMLKDSPFIGLVIDETTDISIYKKLAIFASTFSPSLGKTSVFCLGNYDVRDGAAQTLLNKVEEVMNEYEVPMKKIFGLASDGAAVMIGKNNGVGQKLRALSPVLVQVHCVAHRLSLAASQAALKIQALQKYQKTIDQVFKYYSNSAVRYNRLRELEDVLQCDSISLKEPKPIRWLSLAPAVRAIDRVWPAVVAELEQEKSAKTPVATAMYNELVTFRFVYITKLLLDVLPCLEKLCAMFQKDDLDLSMVGTVLAATRSTILSFKDTVGVNVQQFFTDLEQSTQNTDDDDDACMCKYKAIILKGSSEHQQRQAGNIKSQYIDKLLNNLSERFPDDDMDFLTSLETIFNPKKYPATASDLATYGSSQLDIIVEKYAGTDIINVDRCKQDFLMFKHCINGLKGNTFKDICVKLAENNSEMRKLFPDYSTLASCALVLPLNSACCERAFSTQNRIKHSQRSSLKEETLDILMKISINGPPVVEFPYGKAIKAFEAMKNRNRV